MYFFVEKQINTSFAGLRPRGAVRYVLETVSTDTDRPMPAIYSFPAKSFNCYKLTLWTPSSHNPLNSGWAKSSPSASESLIKQTQKSE